jgi:septal ring factor EnvC (AmiA/AmiB activator)
MNKNLEQLLDAANDLIGLVEDTKQSVESEINTLSGAANEIDGALADLARSADHLRREIETARNAEPATADPVTLAATEAIDNLIALLTEAKNYFASGERLAGIGTLVMFDQHAEDLNAAFRLCKMTLRRKQ